MKYRIIAWDIKNPRYKEPKMICNVIVKDYATLTKKRNKFRTKGYEVHNWPVKDNGNPDI
jgi:hypothetical protein